MKRFKKAAHIITCFFLIITLTFSNLSNDARRVDAASLVVSGGVLAVLADILFSIGITAVTVSHVKSFAESIAEYTSKKKQEIAAEGRTTLHYSAAGAAHGGAGKSFELSTYDLSVAEEVLSGEQVINSGEEVPSEFINSVRAWAIEDLNISAVDGSLPVSSVTVDMLTYFYSFAPVRSGSYDNMTVAYSGAIWYDGDYYFLAPGTSLTVTVGNKVVATRIYDPDSAYSNGIQRMGAWGFENINGSSSYSSMFRKILGVDVLPLVTFPSGFSYSSSALPLNVSYFASPSIDISYADTNSVVWNGASDLETTLSNQAAAGSQAEYVDSTFTGNSVTNLSAYNTLNYIFDSLAQHWGTGTIDSGITDTLILDMSGATAPDDAAERQKLAQQYAALLLAQYATSSPPPEDPEDNKNKRFKVLDTLVSAYLACLIANRILPSNTPELEAGTQVENIAIVSDLSEEVPEPTQAPEPTQSPKPTQSPEPDPDPDFSLAGILEWLSKIFNAILGLPQSIIDGFKNLLSGIQNSILELPDKFANSRLGQWIQSIPGSLADIEAAVLSVPEAITDFFTLDTSVIGEAYGDLADSFKSRFSGLNQLSEVFVYNGQTFSKEPPVFTMTTPDCLKFAINSDTMVILDLRPYAEYFLWVRVILNATLWLLFAKWLMLQFDIKFHVG